MASDRSAIVRVVLASALASLLSLGTAARASAQEPSAAAKATARALMDEGFDRRERGELRGALESFRAADALVHVPTTGLEVARVEEALGLLVEARDHLEAVVASSPTPGEPRELGEARAAAARASDDLDGRIPSLRVVLDGAARDGASIAIDGEPIPRAARDVAHHLNPGAHVVVARAPSGREARASVTLRERETRSLVLTLPEAPQVSATPAIAAPVPARASPRASTSAPPLAIASTPSPSRSPWARDHAIAIAGFATAGAGLLVGSIAGGVALAHKSSAASQCIASQCPATTFHDLDAAQTASTVSDVAFVVAGIGLVVGAFDLVVPRDRAPAAARAVQPFVGLGAAGVRGSF